VEALRGGDPRDVAAVITHGADVRYRRDHGYTALIDAVQDRDVSRDVNLLALLQLLVSHGADVSATSRHQESALRRLSHQGRFDAVKLLLDAGADAAQLVWTPLMRAVALGLVGDVERELARGAELEALDWWRRSAFALALVVGDPGKIGLLFDRGANADVCGAAPALFYAIDGHHAHAVRWLLDVGADANQADASGVTALMHAADLDDADCAAALLAAGADVDRYVFGTALNRARDRAVVERLLAAGADPSHLSHEGRRAVLGLPPDPDGRLMTASAEEFGRAPTRRFGRTNPEPMTEPFWAAMIRSGISAYGAGQTFCAPLTCPRDPIWSAHRFGQSTTFLPDGRIVLIAGEHEDHYDPDFCIYNDVFVRSPDGAIAIYGYPETVFPPTDFHSASLVGSWIYIIGSLGYRGRRRYGATPVFRLSIDSFSIEQVEAAGDAPGWIYGHRADAAGESAIHVHGGTVVVRSHGKADGEVHEPNRDLFVLDLESRRWRQAQG
jgi:hypothetical protein